MAIGLSTYVGPSDLGLLFRCVSGLEEDILGSWGSFRAAFGRLHEEIQSRYTWRAVFHRRGCM